MKKILLLIVTLFMITGCGEVLDESKAEEIYVSAISSMSFENADIKITNKESDEESSVEMKMRDLETFDQATAHFKMSAADMTMEYYLSEGVMYMNMFDMKVKSTVDEADYKDTFNPEEFVDATLENDIDFKYFTFKPNGRTINYTVDVSGETADELGIGEGKITYIVDSKTETLNSFEVELVVDDQTMIISANLKATSKIEMADFSTYVSMDDVE